MSACIFRSLISAMMLFSLFTFTEARAQDHHSHSEDQTQSDHAGTIKRCDFKAAMRELWEDHVTWTRLFIVSAAGKLPSTEATTHRLLQNQTDIGNAVKTFYGEPAGNKLTELLKEHIIIAAQLLAAAQAGDTEGVGNFNNKWLMNADEIGTFLHEANPKNWPIKEMKSMMREHLSWTTAEVVAHLGQDWENDIALYDKARAQILHMADMLSLGIMKQFPSKFTSH